jgi:hypothetical protein
MVLFFRPPKPRNVAITSALCLLSLAITPKYAMQLFFGFLGYMTAAYLNERQVKKLLIPAIAGAALCALFVLAVYAAYGISLVDNIRAAHILSSKLGMTISYDFLFQTIMKYLTGRPLFGSILLLGVIGWARRSWRKMDSTTLAGTGILLGSLILCFIMKFPLEQYQTPIYISLAIFSPFAFAAFEHKSFIKGLRLIFTVVVFLFAVGQIPAVGREFRETNMNFRDTEKQNSEKSPPVITVLSFYDKLLSVIPKDEKVIALWVHNPLFRRDITGMTGDDRPSLTGIISKDDPLNRFFDPAVLIAELEKRPPALIDLVYLNTNYPPGWFEIIADFVFKNPEMYQPIPSPLNSDLEFYLRTDLAERLYGYHPDRQD